MAQDAAPSTAIVAAPPAEADDHGVRPLNVAADVLDVGDRGVDFGFDVARTATDFGFGVASFVMRGVAAVASEATGPANPVSLALHATDAIVRGAQDVTNASQAAARAVTKTSIAAARAGLHVAGAENGELLRLVVGRDAAAALVGVEGVVSEFTAPLRDIPRSELAAAAARWSSLQRLAGAEAMTSHRPIPLPPLAERAMRFSGATMGAAWLAGLVNGPGLADAAAASRRVRDLGAGAGAAERALAAAGIDGEVSTLLFSSGSDGFFSPAHLVAFDGESGAVVVAFRGTASASDAMVDLLCRAAPLRLGDEAGFAHGGMLRAAMAVRGAVEAAVEAALRDFRGAKELLVTGHSLGAGVAALLAALWRSEGRFGAVPLRCVAFACPQVLSPALAAAQEPWTTAVVVGDDAVPRLSLASALDLREATALLATDARLARAPDSVALHDEVREAAMARLDPAVQRLAPAGRILWIAGAGAPPVRVTHAFLGDMIVTGDMVAAHMPHRYLAALRGEGVGAAPAPDGG